MLLSFSVSNFRSIRDEATLSMFALKRVKEHAENTFSLPGNEKVKLLRSMVVYGANASGKSNIFKAIVSALNLINQSAQFRPDGDSLEKFYDPYLLDNKFNSEPTQFSLSFACSDEVGVTDPFIYEYSFSFNKEEIIEESLYFNPRGQKAKLFHRNKNEVTFGEYFSKGNGLFRHALGAQENASKLLLSLVLTFQVEEFKPIQRTLGLIWYNVLNSPKEQTEVSRKRLARMISLNPDLLPKYTSLIKALDTGISEILFENEINFSNELGINHIVDFGTTHRKSDGSNELVPFGLSRESDGTQSIISLAGYLLLALVQGGIFFVDEIDRSLHPKIVEYLFKIFNDPMINTNNAQLIATTHSAMIMRNDLFRRDQIVIAERGDDGASTYYNLAEIQGLRAGVPFERYYYAGMLGGTPDINDVDFRSEFL